MQKKPLYIPYATTCHRHCGTRLIYALFFPYGSYSVSGGTYCGVRVCLRCRECASAAALFDIEA